MMQFCNHLGCDSRGHRLPPPSNGAIRSHFGSDGDYGKGFDSFRIFSCVVLAIILSIFYALWAEMMSSTYMKDDLRRFTRLPARRAWFMRLPARRASSGGANSDSVRRNDGAKSLRFRESQEPLRQRRRQASTRGTLGQSGR